MSEHDGSAGPTGAAGGNYEEIARSPDFLALRRMFRNFVFPLAGLFLAWYLLYVLLSNYAPDFMSIKVFGNVHLGLLIGLSQFVSTFAITMIYSSWAAKKFDPAAAALAARVELSERGR